MSESTKIARNGQWSLTKDEGTGVVQAPKNLGQVADVRPAGAAVPKVTPQPALHEGVMGHRPAVTRDTAISPVDATVRRGLGQRAHIHDYNPQAGAVVNPNAPKNIGWAKPSATPFEDAARAEAQGGSFSGKPSVAPAIPPRHAGGLTGLDRIKYVSQQPISPTTMKSEGSEKLSLNKGGQWNLSTPAGKHCSRCEKKPCECIKTDGILVER